MADDDVTPRSTRKAPVGAPAKQAAARKATAKKVAVTKAPAVKKAPARKVTARPTVKKAAAKKAPAARTPTTGREALLTPRKKAPPPLRLAAEQTFDDDWEPPAPQPPREDPAARVRAVLRAAALSLETGDAPPARAVAPAPPPPPPLAPPPPPPPPAPPPPAPRPADEPVTRVLVAPVAPDPDLDEEAEEEAWAAESDAEWEAELEEEQEDAEWSPPEVLDEETPPPPRPPPPAPPAFAPTSPIQVITAPPQPSPPPPPAKPKQQKHRKRKGRSIVLTLGGLLVVLAVVIGGVLVVGALRGDGVDYSKLKVGDCFDSSATNEVRGVQVKPCSKPHNSEIFFLVSHPAGKAGPYPGKDALVQFAADACLGQPLTAYLATPIEQSKLKDFEIVPQESAWKDGRRVLVCGLDTGGEGTLTGSVKGTRR